MNLRISFLSLSLSSATASLVDYRTLASRLSAQAIDSFPPHKGNRALDGFDLPPITTEVFRNDICGQLIPQILNGIPEASCSCLSQSFAIDCTLPDQCGVQDDCGGEVCAVDTTMRIEFADIGGIPVVVVNDLTASYAGSDYEGERFSILEGECKQYYRLDGIEYQCNSCSQCEDGGVMLDCSNIQPGAVSETCVSYIVPEDNEDSFISFCPEGGASTPSDGGVPYTSGSRHVTLGIASAAAVFIFLGL